MRILVIAAVDFELDAARKVWEGESVCFLRGGVGAEATRKVLEDALDSGGFDRVLDIGIAGSYRPDLLPGAVVHVTAERHADGAGEWLLNPSPWPELDFLPVAKGNTLQMLDDRFRVSPADIESMEGAAVFEVCLRRGIPFAEIRSISNAVGERDHANWDIPAALSALESALNTLKTRLL
ncbi:MAG: hypothetical protein IJ636_03445 [Bacteroidales bacterium]|nr:hypothetical protein [Bacteroidales bacterium]